MTDKPLSETWMQDHCIKIFPDGTRLNKPDVLTRKIRALEAEIERLRLALTEIGGMSRVGELPEIAHAPHIAREALDNAPPTEES